jgi:hypothetical protein
VSSDTYAIAIMISGAFLVSPWLLIFPLMYTAVVMLIEGGKI